MDENESLAKVMIVEDEVVVSSDLKRKIEKMGYVVTGCVRYGEKALESALCQKPDIVLMDVQLKGEMDGTQAAKQIVDEMELPIIFLTAYSDIKTIAQAKKSAPFSYLTKPIRIEDLKINLEMALYKRTLSKQLEEERFRFRTVADYTYDWETWISPEGELLYISPSCLRITGYNRDEFLSNPDLLYSIISPDEKSEIKTDLKCHHDHEEYVQMTFYIERADGEKRLVEHICHSVYSSAGVYLGRRASNRDITERRQAEEAKEKLILELKEAMENIKLLGDLIPICCNCKKIRDDEGYWNQVEEYLKERTGVQFSHGICPDCARQLYPDQYDRK